MILIFYDRTAVRLIILTFPLIKNSVADGQFIEGPVFPGIL